jgi:hypothetical protein
VMPLPPSNFEIVLISSSVPSSVHLSTLSAPPQQTYCWSSLSHSEDQQIFQRQKVINAAFDECKCLLYNSIMQSELLRDMYPFLDSANGARRRCTDNWCAVFRGTKSAIFVPPFEKDLLTRLHCKLALIHSTVHVECIELFTSAFMISCDIQKGGTKATVHWIGEASKIRCTVCP